MKKWIWVIAAFALAMGMTLESPASAMPECTPDVLDDGSVIHGQVYDAKPIEKKPARIKAMLPKRTMGAKLYVRAEKGVTPAYLQRAAECHAKSRTTPSYQHDPLRVDGNIESIRVYSAGGSFVLSVVADNPGTGREIWERAKALASEIDSGLVKAESEKAYD
jgi:hypothetical protein